MNPTRMKIPDISISEAEAALADLYASTGIDLRGYGHIFGVDDDIVAECCEHLGDGEISFLLDDRWTKMPGVREFSIDRRAEIINVASFSGGPGARMLGLQSIDIVFEAEFHDAVSPALIDDLQEHAGTRMRIGSQGKTLSAKVFLTRHEMHQGPLGGFLRCEMTVSGDMAEK